MIMNENKPQKHQSATEGRELGRYIVISGDQLQKHRSATDGREKGSDIVMNEE
jgi:hypothetical protein